MDNLERAEGVYIFRMSILSFREDQPVPSGALEEAVEEPMGDEIKAIESYPEAKKRGDVQLVPLEDVIGKA